MSEQSRPDPAEFHALVYDLVRTIPYGRVTTYGHIAKLAHRPNYSRLVGSALRFLSEDTTPPVPWWRVIGAAGVISERMDGGHGASRQAERLREEGVEVTDAGEFSNNGRWKISMSRYGWLPEPSAASQ